MKIHFQKASLRLSALYLGIIMLISLFFSFNIYQLSVQEYDRSLRSGVVAVEGPFGSGVSSSLRSQILAQSEQQYKDAKQRIFTRLALINLLILVGGGFLSYYLARWTLRPIEETHASLERFTADASHELRTPIAAMQAETEVALMNKKISKDEAVNQLKSNLEELAKLNTLSSGLLKLAHSNGNKTAGSKVSAEALINNAIGRVVKSAEAKRILISHKPAKKLTVIGEESSLTEALVTILDNAVKYSPEKTEIGVLARTDGGFVNISIKDQGIGIKASQLPHIFDRFYRGDSSRSKQKQDGYGLGLAIAKDIVESSGGKISAVSELGQGSTFTVKLPASY